MKIALVKGFLESAVSNEAGIEDVALKIQALIPGVEINRFKWSDQLSPHDIFIANSWGVASVMDWLDKNPTIPVSMVVSIDGVNNLFKGQWPWNEWDISKRPNVTRWLFFREPYSILRGCCVRGGTIVGQTYRLKPFAVIPWKGALEYALNEPDEGSAFMEHFELLPLHPIAVAAILDAVRSVV